MSVSKRKRTSSKQNVSTANSDSDPIVFITSDTEEKYVDIVMKNLKQFFEIANKHDFQLSIHGESPTKVSVRLTKSSGKGNTENVVSEMNKLIVSYLKPADKHKLNAKEYGYLNEKILFQQENLEAIRDSSDAVNSLAKKFSSYLYEVDYKSSYGGYSELRRPKVLTMHIHLFLDYMQKDPLLKPKRLGLRLDELFVTSWLSDWKHNSWFPCVEDVIMKPTNDDDDDEVDDEVEEDEEEEAEDKILNVFGTVHLLHVSTEKGQSVFGLLIFKKKITFIIKSSTEAEVIAALHKKISVDRYLLRLWDELDVEHDYKYHLATHLPVAKEHEYLFLHVDQNDIWDENEEVITFIKNNFKCLQYTLPNGGYHFMKTVASVYNVVYSLLP